MIVSSYNSYVEILMPNGMVLGGGAFEMPVRDITWYWIADGSMSLEFRDKVWAENTNLVVLRKDGRFKARGWISTSRCGSIDRKVGTRLIGGSLVNYIKV